MWVLILAPLALVFFISFRINSLSVGAAQAILLDLCGAARRLAVLDLRRLHGAEHHPGVLHRRRDLRRDVALRLHDQARPDRSSARS